ncbi:MAG: replicative DNA helicase [Deltaproteobacteria bacterium]|nr:replicative DNA helicase [Deltaproteobacteria bacterium]
MANSSIQKLPPQNLEAEQAVLGSVLLDNDALYRSLDYVRPDDFYRAAHQHIFQSFVDLAESSEPVDLVTLTNHLKSKDLLGTMGGSAYLTQLVESVPTSANVQYYAKIVREKAILRKIISAATEIVAKGYEEHASVDDFLDYAETAIFSVAEERIRPDFTHIKDVVKENFKRIEQLYERKESVTGVPTGFHEFDKLTSGLQRSDLIIIAGRPSMGKTSFALNIAQHAAIVSKTPVAVFSLEMSKEQLVMRMLTSLAKVDSSRLRIGKLKENEWPKLTKAASQMSVAPIFIDDTPALSVLDMRAKCRRLKADHNMGLLIVDYLQLMRGRGGFESREREISEISRSLKALAKELNVPVIALSQLNRGVENRPDKRPQLSDLRESGAIEQDADLITFIYRDEIYNKESDWTGTAEIIIRKQRNGPTGAARLAFLHEYTTFENLAFEHATPN